MTQAPTRYPLQWPVGWKRIPPGQRIPGMFAVKAAARDPGGYRGLKDITVSQAVERLGDELRRMGVPDDDVLISTNLRLRLDGLPRSDQGEPADPGAAVYWQDGSQHRCMAIDRYTRVAQNIAALAATIEAMRAIERHGGAAILDRAFTGFTALPAPIAAGMKRDWQVVLELQDLLLPTAEDVERAYRTLAARFHPDRPGGSTEKMAELNVARSEALEEVSRKGARFG